MPIGATSTLPAWAAPRLVCSPVLGRWNVTVRSARTAGSEGSPLVRSTAVAAAWNDGRVVVPDTEFLPAPWLPALLDEVLNFTGVSDLHDDQVDALAAGFDALNSDDLGGLIGVKRNR